MGKKILAAVAGILCGAVLIALIQFLSHQIYPPPEGMEPGDREAMKAFVATLPAGAFLWVLASYAVGSLGGGWVAARIARAMQPALAVGVVLTLMGILNVLMIPHPVWFMICVLLVFLPPAYLGGRLALR